jgi:hypothetical protein
MVNQNRVLVEIQITPEQRRQVETLARRRGYADLDEYLRALIEADAEAHGESLALEDEDPVTGFEEGWRDAMTGNTYPISTLWDDLDEGKVRRIINEYRSPDK